MLTKIRHESESPVFGPAGMMIISSIRSMSSSMKSQQSPFIEDIDLLDEVITIRNPSVSPRDIAHWSVSDDIGNNTFKFPRGTVIQPKGELNVYCCAKGRTKFNTKPFHIFWTNKDGTNRMKNVLNDGKIFAVKKYFLSTFFM